MVPRNHAEIGRCPESKGTNAHDPSPHAPSLSLLRVARKCHGPGRALAPLHLPSTPPSVLRDPHQMQMNLKYRVRAPSGFWHPLSLPAARLLKPSPVRRGLQPSQTGTVIDHAEAYVDGQVHTNGCENFWSLLKRGITRTYVSVEPFHLFRYLDEQSFRYNNR